MEISPEGMLLSSSLNQARQMCPHHRHMPFQLFYFYMSKWSTAIKNYISDVFTILLISGISDNICILQPY